MARRSLACAGLTTCWRRKNRLSVEIHGTAGSLTWDLEDLNRLSLYLVHGAKIVGVRGFDDVLATEKPPERRNSRHGRLTDLGPRRSEPPQPLSRSGREDRWRARV